MKRIAIITGTRAEYGLLKWLIKELKEDSFFIIDLIVTGTHLSKAFGETYKEIEEDGITIDHKLEIFCGDTKETNIAEAMGLAITGLTSLFLKIKPDLLIILGDRYEALASATAATLSHLPIAHIHGGEITEGAMDDVFRHAITKMSHLHFTALPEYQKRVVQMGEDPKRVFCVGGLGVDAISKVKLFSKEELEKEIGFKFLSRNLLVTIHPTTLDLKMKLEDALSDFFKALLTVTDCGLIFTAANADQDGAVINQKIKEFVDQRGNQAIFINSLGQKRYFSLLRVVDGVVGNSSSGLLEVPSFKIGTLNIGDRQKGRVRAPSVIDTTWNRIEIESGLKKILSTDFKNEISRVVNPYGGGNSASIIKKHLLDIDLKKIINKKFYDLG